jgi:hypothetical protein
LAWIFVLVLSEEVAALVAAAVAVVAAVLVAAASYSCVLFSLAFGSGSACGSGGGGGGSGGSGTVVSLFCCSNTGCHGCQLVDIVVMKTADVGDVVVCTKILYFHFEMTYWAICSV